MPRRRDMDASDSTVRCTLCAAVGQVPDPQNVAQFIPCPMCGGIGRVSPAARTAPEVRAYRRAIARATNAIRFDE
jgi:predicted RNA-binding Zn-ribbon protein involved in translation (DUF1610 family)